MRARSPELAERARQLRREATPAEEVLWQALRRGQLNGLHFRRQHAIDRFILDFYCPRYRLCVEVDGAVHEGDDQRARDAERTELLAARGITVLRFTNKDVLSDLPRVLRAITAAATPQIFPDE
ncbi:MAG TPA: endonuclease domain-containing protein [Longimicrobium sp.]|jgi:adenine-specific DNA-methyltransferase